MKYLLYLTFLLTSGEEVNIPSAYMVHESNPGQECTVFLVGYNSGDTLHIPEDKIEWRENGIYVLGREYRIKEVSRKVTPIIKYKK